MALRATTTEVSEQLRQLLGTDIADDAALVAAVRARLTAEYEQGFRDGFRDRGKGGKLNDRGVPRAFRVITNRRRKKWKRRLVGIGVGAVIAIGALLIFAAAL